MYIPWIKKDQTACVLETIKRGLSSQFSLKKIIKHKKIKTLWEKCTSIQTVQMRDLQHLTSG